MFDPYKIYLSLVVEQIEVGCSGLSLVMREEYPPVVEKVNELLEGQTVVLVRVEVGELRYGGEYRKVSKSIEERVGECRKELA